MRASNRVGLQVLLALLAAMAVEARSTLRCDGRLVSTGDWDLQVRETCGEPYFVEYWRQLVSGPAPAGVAIATEVAYEAWYFDQGSNRFLQRVTLRDGRVVRIDTLSSYGRNDPLRECSGASVRTGMSIGELVSLCGLPSQRRGLGEALIVGESPSTSVLPTRRERWLYPLRNGRWLIAELVHGRVEALDTTPPR